MLHFILVANSIWSLLINPNRELDELEREDFTRLKMVKKKKEEQIKADEKLAMEQQAAEEAKGLTPTQGGSRKSTGGGGSFRSGMEELEDDDVVFK